MAIKVRMTNFDTGICKNAYIGFSWTTFFFGIFPALFRLDLPTFFGGFVIYATISIVYDLNSSSIYIDSMILLGYIGNFIFLLGWAFMSIIWAFIYNKYYTIKLIENGYVFDDSEELNNIASEALGVNRFNTESKKTTSKRVDPTI